MFSLRNFKDAVNAAKGIEKSIKSQALAKTGIVAEVNQELDEVARTFGSVLSRFCNGSAAGTEEPAFPCDVGAVLTEPL